MDNQQKQFAQLSSDGRRKLLAEMLRIRAINSNSHQLASGLAPISKVDRNAALPISFSQERLWFLSKLEPENLSYNIVGSVRLIGKLQTEYLSRSISEIIRRHEVLRTTIREVDGRPVQVISPPRPFNIVLVDLQGGDEESRQERSNCIVAEETQHTFDLSVGPLMRVKLLKLRVDEYLLILNMHHAVTDGWSFGVFAREMEALYKSLSEGKLLQIPDLPIQYADYAYWQREWLQGEVLERLLEYWKKKLGSGLAPLKLPTDHPRPIVQSHRGANHTFVLPEVLLEKLKELSKNQRATLFMTLLAVFKVLLYQYTGQTDFAVGSPNSNRMRSELEGLIGFFVNTLVLRTDLSGNPKFIELLEKVRETALGAFAHQELPFEKLVQVLNPMRDMSYSPLFQVMFAFQNVPQTAMKLPSLTIAPVAVNAETAMFDLTLYMWEEGKGLSGKIEYNKDLFYPTTIERMSIQFTKLLEGITMNPESRLLELVRSTEGETGQPNDVDDFLSELKSLGIRFSAEEGRLRIDAPKGVLSPVLREKISDRKDDILGALVHSGNNQNGIMPLQKVSRKEPLCLSFSQERLWFLYQLDPENISYNIAICSRLKGHLRVDVLKACFSEIVRRHEALRTTFTEVGGQPVQVVSSPSPVNIQIEVMQGASENERKEIARMKVIQEMQRSFDLRNGPLVRFTLLQQGNEDYLLVVTLHHIIADGWSLGVFGREIEALYRSFGKELPSPLPEPSLQYADFAYSHRLWMQNRVLDPHLLYWKRKLADIPMLQLPADRSRPVVQRYRGGKKWFKLTQEIRDGLGELSRNRGVTLFMTLLAAFNALLYRYTGQADFAVGTPIANRNRPEIEGVIGLFMNTLVLRTDLSGDPCFAELLGKVKETTLEAQAHQDAPFEKVVEALNLRRDMSYSPLFQVMFAFQNYPWNEANIEGLTITPELIDPGTAMFDLSLYMWEEKNKLSGSIEYNSDIFDESTIERMVGHFEVLLGSVVANPEKRLSELTLLTPSELRQVLVDWNLTTMEYPGGKCFHLLFEEQAERSSGVTAVICAGENLSYGELNSRSNQVAHYLRGLGAQPDSIVGIYVDRSIDMVVGLLGILKAGSAYTPLDPSFPKDRIEFMLKDSNAGILITQEELSGNITEFSGRRICIDSDWNAISRENNTNPSPVSGPDDLAYVIYTSGSTGQPKGVQIAHKALVNFLYSMMREPGMTAADTILSVTTMSFDIFGLELYLPLLCGGKAIIAQREDSLDGTRLASLILEHDVSIMQATPSTWRLMIEAGWRGTPSLSVICGGEAFPKDLVAPLLKRCKELWNLYGPTETTIWSTAYRVKTADDPILIGRPVANTQTYILDNQMQPLPIGIIGELHIGGDGLSRGYLNRPELTAEKFISHPFNEDPKERIYKTGDLARYRSDGMIECLGRIDHQVKVRGFRIELGEIEARIKDVESIRNCVVVVREDHPGDQRLVAYYIARDGREVSQSDLTRYLHTKLPEYMVPQQYVKLQAIPLTPNGKVDRKALPKPDLEKETRKNYVPPQSETEIAVSAIWKQVLKIDKLGIHDNFFELGGHSLLIAQVLNRVKENITENASMLALFQYPTIASFSKYLAGRQTDRSSMQQALDRARMKEENIKRQKGLRKGRGAANG